MKKMKKVWMLALLAAGFAMVLGCSNGSSDDEKDPTPNPDIEQPSDPGDDKVITVFDPATYSGKVGEVVDKDGVKYLKVTPSGYNTTIDDFFDGDGINLSGKTKFKAVMFGEKANAAVNFTIKLADKDNADISTIAMYQISAEPTEKEAGVAEQQSWNTVSETFLCTRIQPVVQDGADPWGERDDTTVYFGKITAE